MRTRISDRLARATAFPVTLVIAPAGFGKTVALRDYIISARLDVVRYDVRREDVTLLAFARGLADALVGLAPSAPAAFPEAQQRVLAAPDPVRELADWFCEHLRRAVGTVVVDDLHHATDPRAAELLAQLVDRTYERIAWIVASRSDAGLPVASWLAYERMDVPIGEDELRFTPDEALATAEETQPGADPREVEELRTLTGGWPVALAIALRTRPHVADLRAAASGTREMVYRYLAEQVYAGLTRPQQRFLLDTCVFPSFDVEIAEAYGATADSFAELRRAVTFLLAISATAYRYHDLFRDFLEFELRRAGAAPWHDALVTAAALLERRGDTAGALALYTRAGEPGALLALIERAGFALFERGAVEHLALALDRIPEHRRAASAAALGLRATIDAGSGRFDVAESAFAAAIAGARDPALRIALVHRYALELVRHGRDCVALLEPEVSGTAIAPAARVALLGTLATGYVGSGRTGDAVATVQRALERADVLDDAARARLYQQAAYVHQFADRERARRFATMAVELAVRCDLYEVAARAYSVLFAVVEDEDEDRIASLAILDELRACARKGASRQARLFGTIASYAIEVERGDDAALERLERELTDSQDTFPVARSEALLPAEALRAAWSGDFTRAHALLAGSAAQQGSDARRGLRAAEIALYAYGAGDRDAGDASADDANAALARVAQPSRRFARAHLLLALAALVRGRSAATERHLTEAERAIAPPMRRLRAFAHAVRALQRAALDDADPAVFSAALERMRAEHLGGIARLLAALPQPATAEAGYAQLTAAEREILRMLASGASSKELAARTGRSAQTVDTHIRSICRKLHCSGRREAVALAVRAGWIPNLVQP